MRVPARTLYSQIVWLHILLLAAFCVLAVGFTAWQFDAFTEELEQRLNRELAENLAPELEPAFRAGLDSSKAAQAVQRIKAIHPALDIYVLDEAGAVTGSYVEGGLARDTIDLEPIRAFLETNATLPIRAGDPGDAEESEVFSVARLGAGNDDAAYLYVILRGMPLETAADMLRDSYIVRGVAGVLLIALVSTALIGLALFSLLTGRLRRLTAGVLRFKDGAYHGRVAVEPDDEIGRLGGVFNDMASTIEAQIEALERTDEARRTLIANVSHDFRTPLTSLRGYAERLLHGAVRLDEQQRRECLGAILDNTNRLENLVDQLSVLARLDVSADSMQSEVFSIAELVQDVCLKFMPAAERADLTLAAHYDPDLKLVSGDIGLVERALSNLVENAVINTARGGHISIAARATPDGVRVTVADTGCGIEANELPLVTQRFYRTRRSRSLQRPGSGLGLAIARDVAELHGGTLQIDSRDGIGTTVAFTLPAAE